MRRLLCWSLLLGLGLGAAGPIHAQYNYPVPPMPFVGPLSHPRYETGGFYIGLEGLYLRQTRPLKYQEIAYRGFFDVVNEVFQGTGELALSTDQLRGPGNFTPGFNLTLGWLFENEMSVSLNWWHLTESRYAATATLAPPGLLGGPGQANTFLTSPVFNFPIDYFGNPDNATGLPTGATYGIWNAASLMNISYLQRFDKVDLSVRVPISMVENHRYYGLIGPRAVTIWERFRWRTVDYDLDGNASELTTAIYSNVTSNRLYGTHLGLGWDWFLGDTPIGGFSVTLEAEAAIYLDFVKGRAKYELADRSTAATRARNMWSLAPGLESNVKLWWFPMEAIQMQVGYTFLSFFNTMASPRPIDFNMGAIDPEWKNGVTRWLHGLTFGISFVW